MTNDIKKKKKHIISRIWIQRCLSIISYFLWTSTKVSPVQLFIFFLWQTLKLYITLVILFWIWNIWIFYNFSCLNKLCVRAEWLVASCTVQYMHSKNKEKKRKQSFSKLPDGSGWGDHIQLLQVYESWDRADYDPNWCTDNDLQVYYNFCYFKNSWYLMVMHRSKILESYLTWTSLLLGPHVISMWNQHPWWWHVFMLASVPVLWCHLMD